MELEDIFTFGKHKGCELEDVIEDDPKYIEWLVSNDVVSFSEEVYELLSKKGVV